MRIISGIKKGKKLSLPDPKYTRPLRDQVKENIFNILIHQKKFETEILNSIVVDFFSGSGSFGIECLSRQSKKVRDRNGYHWKAENLSLSMSLVSILNSYPKSRNM